MNENLDDELEDIINQLGTQPVAQAADPSSARLAEEIPTNEIYEVPDPPAKWFLTSETFYQSLRRSQRWLRVLGILSIFIYVLMLIGVFVYITMPTDINSAQSLCIGTVALIATVLSIIPSVYMLAYANRLENMNFRRRAIPLSRMIKTQCQMWTVLGIYSLGCFVVGLFVFSLVVVGFSIKASS